MIHNENLVLSERSVGAVGDITDCVVVTGDNNNVNVNTETPFLLKMTKNVFKNLCQEYGKKSKRILIVGDVMLDHKIKGTAAKYENVQKHQIILKGGEVYMVSDEPKTLGGAAHIAMAFSGISNVTLISVIGLDCAGNSLKRACDDHNVQFYLKETSEVKTTTKIYIYRMTEGGAKKVIRFDSEDVKLMTSYCNNEDVQNDLINEIKKNITKTDCVVIKDHQKGIISKEFVKRVSEIASDNGIPLYVDPKYAWDIFEGVTIEAVIPNMKEAASALYDIKKEEGIILEKDLNCKLEDSEYTNLVEKYSNCKTFIIKAASKGAVILSNNAKHCPKIVNPFLVEKREFETDVGCGDTFDAFMIIGLLNEHTVEESVFFANFVAGLKTKKSLGKCISIEDIKNEMEKDSFKNYVKDNLPLVKKIVDSLLN